MTVGEFERFCKRHRAGMYSTAYWVLSDVQRAEDAVRTASLQIFKASRALYFGTDSEEHDYALRAVTEAATALRHKVRGPADDVHAGADPDTCSRPSS